jgi:hypothetical protein
MTCSFFARSLLAGALVLAACSSKDAQEADIPEVAPESVPVLAMIELPAGNSLGSAAKMLDTVQPGASLQAAASIPIMLTSAAEVGSLNGADLFKPVRAVVLDPKKYPKPVLLLVSVSNAEHLAEAVGKERLVVHKDLALIGAPEAAKAAHDYAFGTLARRPAPEAPHAIAYTQPILASFRGEIDAAKAQIGPMMAMMGGGSDSTTKLLTLYIDGLLAVAEQTERVEAHFASHDTLAGVELIVHARPDTALAGFTQAQTPSNLTLIDMLPAHESPVVVMAGNVSAGPARQTLVALGDQILASMWSGNTQEISGWMAQLMDVWTGGFAAMVTSVGTLTPTMVQILDSTDGAEAARITRQLMEKLAASGTPLEVMGMKQTSTFTPEAFVYDGASVMMQHNRTEIAAPADAQTAQPATAFEQKSYFTGIDKLFTMAMGQEQDMRQLIDAVRGKGPRLQTAGALSQAVAASKARNDSILMYMNLGAVLGGAAGGVPQAVVLTCGFDQSRMRVLVAAGR